MTSPRDRLDALRTRAEEQLHGIRAEITALVRDREGANDDDEHDPDGVTLSSEWSRLSGLENAAALELAQIEDALVRVASGTYGVCARCGEPIPAARLEARPFAEFCVRCAEVLGR